MQLEILSRNHSIITDRFRDYVGEKSEKVDGLADRAISLEVKLTRHGEKTGHAGLDRVELTLIGPGPVVRAEAEGSDKYAAFDIALGRLIERLRRAKSRRKPHRGGFHPHPSLREAAENGFASLALEAASPQALGLNTDSIQTVPETENVMTENESPTGYEDSPVVIRAKVFPAKPITLDDALYEMELVGHDFFLYVDSETGRPSVAYRRRGWDFGVIALDLVNE